MGKSPSSIASLPLAEQMDHVVPLLEHRFDLGAGDGLVLIVAKGDAIETVTTLEPDTLGELLKRMLETDPALVEADPPETRQ